MVGPRVTGANEREFSRARQLMPGGVNSPVRAYRSVGGSPRFIVSAKGPYITDVDGRDYVDLVGSWGPAILGHAHPAVVQAVQDAAANGLSFGAPTPLETELARLVQERVAWTSEDGAQSVRPVERLRLVSTGTEATMTAIRLARAATGRDLLVKFAGHYHGHSDSLLAEAGSGVATLSLPGSAGVTAATAAQTLVIPYNDIDAVRAVFAAHGSAIAAVIVEAAAANMGVVPPEPGFNRALAATAHENGALLILDEVLTGFRVGPAGWWGIEAAGTLPDSAGWQPDLFTFGKVIGGGMPLAALGGRADIMDQLAPLGAVYQAGTLSGNPLAVTAGIATLRAIDLQVYRRLNEAADRISAGIAEALEHEGVSFAIQRAGTLFSVSFPARRSDGRSGAAPRNYDQVRAQQAFRYPPFFHAMLDAGISLPPSVFEAWFVSAAHDDSVIDRILAALPAAAKAAAQATG